MTEFSPSERAAAQAELISLADLTTPYALRAAVGLGLPILVKEGITTIEQLADRSGAPARVVRSLVAYLTLKGAFVRPSAESVALTAVGELLTTDQARIMLDPREVGSHLSLALSGLPQAARTGTAGYDAVAGRSFWQTLGQDRVLAASFDRYMAGWAAQWIPDVLAAYDWSTVGHVVDVGGGDGRLLLALLSKTTELKGTLVELASAAERAREALTSKGLADRSNVVVGSFFDPLPPGADLYVLAQVIHDWPDDEAIRILRRCAEAARPNGRVLLVERLVEPAPSLQHLRADLLMLALFGSGERSRAEFTTLASAAGLQVVNTRTIGHDLSFIECAPTTRKE